MIYGSVKNSFLSSEEIIQKCLAYVESERLVDKENGRYEIDQKNVYVNIVSYETTPAHNKEWEAHKQYIDLHYMLKGQEQIDLSFINEMVQQPYHQDEDYLPLTGEKSASVILRPGQYAICFPEDAHKPGIQVGNSEVIRKAIFKIKI